jgi:asparagine synthase (glutamine-hydrolysing)
MPGIVGLVTQMPRQRAESELRRMVESIRHESFYETGTWIDESLGIYVGWAARRGSFCDAMPLLNERGDKILIFSGEEFPSGDTVENLRSRGHRIDNGAASYLVHVAEEDPSFPAGLNGRFHGLLVDRAKGISTLFNDRYGMHRLYQHQSREAFYLACEAKAILAVRPELRSIDPKALGEFVSCGCVLENRSLFKGIGVLPPGSAWILQKNSAAQQRSYFDPKEWESQEILDPEKYYAELRDVFARTLPRYFEGEERIGMSITGGLDTRMIMAWHQAAPGTLPCFSFGGPYRDNQDVLLGRKIAEACKQPHEIIPVGDQFLKDFSRYAERTVYLTDGCADVSRSADLYANEQVRKIAPVRMTGNYGGEVLRRVRAFKPMSTPDGLFNSELLSHVEVAKETYRGLLAGHPLSFAVFKQAPWHHYGLLALEQTQAATRSPYLDNEFVRTVFRAPASTCINNDVCMRLIAEGDLGLSKIRTDRGLTGNEMPVVSAALRQFLEFTFKAEYAYDYGMPQWVAKVDHLFERQRLERVFLGRHKFYHYRVWYRDNLSKYVSEVLLDSRSLARPYLQGKTLERLVRGHIKGDQNHTSAIHKALTLELIHRQFVDSASADVPVTGFAAGTVSK